MKNDEVMVSIHCVAYNHAKYIRKTFESFLNQKTTFKFEVLVHDDASTDGTQEIIKEYAEKYPDIFKPIYQTENQYSKGIRVAYAYNFPRVTGKYSAFCDGDDYWDDENKLQIQYEILEKYEECSMCVHVAQVVSEKEGNKIGIIPEKTVGEGIIEAEEFLRHELIEGWAAQASSFFIRSQYLLEYIKEQPDYYKKMIVGDFPLVLYMLTKGNVYFIDKEMSCYRYGGQGTFRNKRQKDVFFQMKHLFTLVEGVQEYNKYTNGKFERVIKTFIVMQLEKLMLFEKSIIQEYESCYLEEVYCTGSSSFRKKMSYFLRKNMPYLYKLLLWGYEKIKN